MTVFTLRLAGVLIEVHALHESTRTFCGEYLASGEADERVYLSQEDIDAERVRAARQNELDGVPVHNYSDSYLETLALYRKIAEVIIAYDAVVFHGCVLAVDGWAYVFSAPSGTGKTTHARYWLRLVEGSHVLNGDKPLLRLRDGAVFACGTPWQGKECMGCNEDLPIAGVCLLERSTHPHIEPIGFADAVDGLIRQTHRPRDPEGVVRCMGVLGELGTSVPLYRMGCTLDDSCALLSYEAMAGDAR